MRRSEVSVVQGETRTRFVVGAIRPNEINKTGIRTMHICTSGLGSIPFGAMLRSMRRRFAMHSEVVINEYIPYTIDER